MKEVLLVILVITCLNIPIYLELYKHVLKNRAVWVRIVVSLAYWTIAFITQTLAAFAGIIFMYVTVYRRIKTEDETGNSNIWKISFFDALESIFVTFGARVIILLVNLIYIIFLIELTKYNIKAQDIVTYYSEAAFLQKLLLAFDIVIIAPLVEEYIFRHYFYSKMLAPRMPKLVAAFLSAALFTVLHFNISGIPTFFGLGLFCALMYEKKGYWGAALAHSTSNLLTLLFL